tara:strand:- start:560 stop:781 length:222 start_codon:yes stop_codon:yes gene_type:complete
MKQVENINQWVATTINFVGDEGLYLRMSAENTVVWYKANDNGAFTWVMDVQELNEAWYRRGGIPYEDIQTVSG